MTALPTPKARVPGPPRPHAARRASPARPSAGTANATPQPPSRPRSHRPGRRGRSWPRTAAALLAAACAASAVSAVAEDATVPRARDADGERVELDCIIEAHELVDLSSGFTSGVLETMDVERGDVIEKGQVLARLESRVEQATVDLAQARADAVGALRFTEADRQYRQRVRDRAAAVFEQGVSSVETRDEAESQLLLAKLRLLQAQEENKQAQLELARALEALEQRNLRSPINGIVVDRLVSPASSSARSPSCGSRSSTRSTSR